MAPNATHPRGGIAGVRKAPSAVPTSGDPAALMYDSADLDGLIFSTSSSLGPRSSSSFSSFFPSSAPRPSVGTPSGSPLLDLVVRHAGRKHLPRIGKRDGAAVETSKR